MAQHVTTDHFRQLVQKETDCFNQLCDKWTHIMDNESGITEEAIGHIRTTIGKTNLFVNQRFKQFIGLVDDCQLKRGVKETKVDDLQGFWDMIFYQIEDLHLGFKHLQQLQDNNWREPDVQPEATTAQPTVKAVTKRAVKSVSTAAHNKPNNSCKPIVRSKIREQIRNLKNNKQCQQSVDQNNQSFGEKENQKIDTSVTICEVNKKLESNAKSVDKQLNCESAPPMAPIVKRTPLKVALKK